MRRLPLHYAAMEGPIEEVRRLAQDPAAVSARDADGFTPLHFAAMETRGDVIDVLVAAGAEVDATDKWGDTPLWRAVFNSRGRGEAVLALLAAGADRDRQNLHGVSPLALANRIANYDVRQFFESDH
jgi:ankyrin repeat protein